MLHAEYAKLSQILNEGVVKFNQKVKDMWLTKLRVDSVIGQENLNLMRLRTTNLDRVEMSENLEEMRSVLQFTKAFPIINNIKKYEEELEVIQQEIHLIQEQFDDCQATYESLATKDKYLDRTFKNPFADLSPIIVDQCYKFFK
ncbi:jg310 [Pararge aegeria aegeria]|uniref:Jg310 protein n=1 Tax=Pararge aegeria aegeria TaxID=348720 RepID=A0A8S4RP23_9NEOP|nr:jg310 [Pararge aegeria aegeria]